jgi:hypothetical protein
MQKRLAKPSLTWEDPSAFRLGKRVQRRASRSSALAPYPRGGIFMQAGPPSAEIADLIHCGNILTRCAAANARRAERRPAETGGATVRNRTSRGSDPPV